LQMIILPFIPILALIVQTSLTLQEILEYRADVADIETQVCNKAEQTTSNKHTQTDFNVAFEA